MLKNYIKTQLVLILVLLNANHSYSQTSPVSISTVLNYPNSIYLPDYYSAGSNKLVANLILNDFNEPSVDVYLRIRIESQDVKITTKSDYYPSSPISLYPGELMPFSGDGLEEYLNYNNINLEGISYSELLERGGRLPEGFYSFCVEAYDMLTHSLLSNSSCAIAHLTQYEPPRIINPSTGSVIGPGVSQNIVFSWVNEAPIDPSNISYKFTLHELIEPGANPEQAIDNKQTLIIHEEETTSPMFNYNTSHPLLETGKTYIYTVQALALDGKAMFKNDGVSEASYFYYGYPGGGEIKLIAPEDDSALQLTKEKTFSWSSPDNLLIGQNYYYEIKIAKVDSTKEYEDLLVSDSLIYELQTEVKSGSANYYQNVTAHFPTGENFIWQVTAYTDEQEIAKSGIAIFGGPPCILDFIGANEYIKVSYTEGCDLTDLSGKGTVQINKEGDEHEIWFDNVRIEKDGVQYYLREGEVLGKINDLEPIKLNPLFSKNGEAFFYPDSLKITRYDFLVKGHVEWSFPHAADQEDVPVIKSVPTWVNFAEFSLIGPLDFPDSLGFDLLDPMNFRMDFTEGSRFYIRGENDYLMEFNGNITFPENVIDPEENQLVIPFTNHEQIFKIYSDTETEYQSILVANKTTLKLTPVDFVFDLDNETSPLLFEGDPLWRGFYIKSGIYSFEGDLEYSKQFANMEAQTQTFNFDEKNSAYAYIINDGLWLNSDISFEGNNKMFFNTFPAYLTNFNVDVSSSQTNEGSIVGELVIPFLSDTDYFPFTCNLTQYGFQPGFLDESVDEKKFTYNADGGEQLLYITFNRGYFADNERLESNITIDWPLTGLSFTEIPQFRIWGNYDIGFGTPNNGHTLSQQQIAQIKGFDLTFDAISAGRQADLYALGFTGTMQMGEDVSGVDGPPVVNMYSIFESSLIDEQYVISGVSDYVNDDQTTTTSGSVGSGSVGDLTDEQTTVGDLDALMASYEAKQAEAQQLIDEAQPNWAIGEAISSFDLQAEIEILTSDSSSSASEVAELSVDNLSLEDIIQILEYIAPFLDGENAARVNDFLLFIKDLNDSELLVVLEQFSDLRGLLAEVIEAAILSGLEEATKPVQEFADDINEKISTPILEGTEKLTNTFCGYVDDVINACTQGAIELCGSSEKMVERVNELSVSSKELIKAELKRTVNASVQKNIIEYLTSVVDYVVYDGTIGWLSEEIAKNSASVISDKNFNFKDIDIDLDGQLDNIGNHLVDKFTFDTLKSQIELTLREAYDGFNWDSLQKAFVEDFVVNLIADKALELIGGELGEFSSDVIGSLAQNVDLDFSNLGDKVKSGDLSGIVKFDPSKIVIRSQPADIDGFVNFFEDDPIWGDCWQAEINASIKIPDEESAFIVLVNYINGNKPKSDEEPEAGEVIESYKYWFIEVGVMDIEIPLGGLPIAIYGMKGKIYHHMCRLDDNITYQPNDSIRYGAGLRVYMYNYDQSGTSNGLVVDMNLGLELELLSGGFVFELNGEALIANTPEDVVETDSPGVKAVGDGTHTYKKSTVYSNGFLKYNSVDKHFLGELNAELLTQPALCASGGLKLDISKEWWQFAIGTRVDPLSISILCKDTIFRGWFDVNKTGLDIGLMVNIGLDVRTPYIDLKVVKVQGWMAFNLDLEAELIAYWKPVFGIQKARVYLDLYAGAGINYKTPPLFQKEHTFTIAAFNFGGELEFATIPEAYLRGEMHGSVTVLNCSVGLSFEADVNL